MPDRSPGYELFSHPFGTYTHVSATWRRDAHCWVVLYGTASSDTNQTQPMVARFSTDLVRWSDPQPIFDPLRDAAYGTSWMHDPSADHISDIPPRQAAKPERLGLRRVHRRPVHQVVPAGPHPAAGVHAVDGRALSDPADGDVDDAGRPRRLTGALSATVGVGYRIGD